MRQAEVLARALERNDEPGIIILDGGLFVNKVSVLKELLIEAMKNNPEIIPAFVEAISEVRVIN